MTYISSIPRVAVDNPRPEKVRVSPHIFDDGFMGITGAQDANIATARAILATPDRFRSEIVKDACEYIIAHGTAADIQIARQALLELLDGVVEVLNDLPVADDWIDRVVTGVERFTWPVVVVTVLWLCIVFAGAIYDIGTQPAGWGQL